MKDINDSNRVHLEESTHKYTVRGHEHLKYESATTWIKSHFPIFNGPAIAKSLIERFPHKYGNKTVKEILGEWNKTATIGTSVHLELENWCKHWQALPPEERAVYSTFPEMIHPKAKHGELWLKEILEPHFVLYPEVKLSNEELQIAGTLDLLIYDPHLDKYMIADWKTNKAIKATAQGKGNHMATCFLDDCHLSHYGLQMSLYQWMLEEEYGLEGKIVGRNLVHLRPKPTRTFPLGVKIFETPYLKYNILKMIEARLAKKAAGKQKYSK